MASSYNDSGNALTEVYSQLFFGLLFVNETFFVLLQMTDSSLGLYWTSEMIKDALNNVANKTKKEFPFITIVTAKLSKRLKEKEDLH